MIRYPQPESNILEFKRELPRNNQIIKTAIGFCNTYGGALLIGVADNREIVGVDENCLEEVMASLDKAIFEACSPQIRPRLYVQRFGDKTVLVIEVSEGMNKPYFQRSEGIAKGTFIRLGRNTLRATAEIIEELKWASKGIEFEQLPVFSATREDLDFGSVQDFLKNRKNRGGDEVNEEILRGYGIVAHDQVREYPSVLGVLLFGKNPQQYYSEAMIICSHFRGISGRETIATVDCEGTLFNQFKQAYAFVTGRLSHSFIIDADESLARKEALEVPAVAIREALLNMVVHRNYHTKAPSKIAIYDDRIEFFSPGAFPGPISVEHLTTGVTYLRNPGICKVLREAGYIEKLGSGFIAIFEAYEKAHLQKPYVLEESDAVKCVLPRLLEKAPLVQSDSVLIKTLFERYQEVSLKEIAQTLAVSRPTAVRRINKMIKNHIIARMGKTKGVRYRLIESFESKSEVDLKNDSL